MYYYYWSGLKFILMVEYLLRVREVPGSIPSQGQRHTEDVNNGTTIVPLFNGKQWLFLKINK